MIWWVSWSKLITIGPLFGIDKPLAFVGSNLLLMEAMEGHVVLYNIRELPIKGAPRSVSSYSSYYFCGEYDIGERRK